VPDFGLVVDRNRRPTGREESDKAHGGISFHLLLVDIAGKDAYLAIT
jgi:hypothetical protein